MTQRARCWVLGVVAVCSCSRPLSHTAPIDAWLPDAGLGTECRTPAELWGRGGAPPWPLDCGGTQCADGLAMYAVSGSVITTCNAGSCYSGRCPPPGGGGGPPPRCGWCGDGYCEQGQICIDYGNGEQCADVCLHERTRPRGCVPMSASIPPVGVPNVNLADTDPRYVPEMGHGCRLWFQAFAPPGSYALAGLDRALPHWATGAICLMGDACVLNADGSNTCTCGGTACGAGEVCVIDDTCPGAALPTGLDGGMDGGAPDGGPGCRPRCVPACRPSP